MNILYQIAIIFGICLAGEAISALLPFPFPASIIALLLMLIFLFSHKLKVEHIKEKSDFLLSNMAFFFIPAGVKVIDHVATIKDIWWQFIIIVVVSTLAVFAVTAGSVSLVLKIQRKVKK